MYPAFPDPTVLSMFNLLPVFNSPGGKVLGLWKQMVVGCGKRRRGEKQGMENISNS